MFIEFQEVFNTFTFFNNSSERSSFEIFHSHRHFLLFFSDLGHVYSICQSLSHTTHKIYGKCTAAILVYLKLPAELSINSYWLLKFVLLSVINFIGWRVYSCLVKFFGCIFFKQLIYHLPTTREINAFDVYYTCSKGLVSCSANNVL